MWTCLFICLPLYLIAPMPLPHFLFLKTRPILLHTVYISLAKAIREREALLQRHPTTPPPPYGPDKVYMDTCPAAPCWSTLLPPADLPCCPVFCPYVCSSSCLIPGCFYSRIILLFQTFRPSVLSFFLFYCWFIALWTNYLILYHISI